MGKTIAGVGPATAALVLLVALAQRLLTAAVVLAVVGRDRFAAALMSWDAKGYAGIVRDGYHLTDDTSVTNLAYFPLYPGAAKALTLLPGVSTGLALIALAWAGSVLAAFPIFAIGTHLHSAGRGWLLTLLWGAAPQSVVLVMGYPEGLFTAATAFGLLFVLRRQPLAAALSCVVAGLLRPAALPLVALVVVWALLGAARSSRGRRTGGGPWRWLAAAVVTPLGLGAYLLYVGWRMGHLFGYLTVQTQWNLHLKWPWEFVHQISHHLTTANQLVVSIDMYIPIVLAYATLLLLLVGRWREEGYPWVVGYTVLASLFILARSTYFWSEPRQFLPLFPLLLPLTTIRTSRWAWAAVVVGATAASAWLGAALLASGQYSI